MRFPLFKKWQIILLIIFLLLAAALFAAPRVARYYLVKHSPEWIGRKIDIDRIRINYFTGTFRIDGFTLYEKDDTSTFFRLDHFRINLEYLPLFHSEIRVASLNLEGPSVKVLQSGDRFNFSDLLELSSSDTTVADTAPSEPLQYVIHNIRIAGGQVSYTDVPLKNTIALTSLDLSIPGFTWNGASTKLAVDFRFMRGGGLFADLNLNQVDSTYRVHLKLDSLNLSIFQPYAINYLNISKLEGLLTNDLTIQGSLQHVMQVVVSGSNKVAGFRMADLQERTILSCKEMSLDIDTFVLLTNRLSLTRVELTEPYVLVEMIDSTNNWMNIMRSTGGEEADTLAQAEDSASPDGAFTFQRLVINKGSVEYIDKTLRYPFDYTVNDIALETTPDNRSPGNLKLHISAAPGGTGRVVSDLVFNPDDLTSMDIGLSISQFHMSDLDAYFKHYFGFPVKGGLLNFTTANTLRPGKLVTNNKLNLRRFTLGEKTGEESAYNIPLRLAVGVMSDRNGIIDLDATAESRGDDVQVHRLGRIVFRIIGNLFVKAATSPYKLLAGKSGLDPERLKEIDLPPGDAMLTSDGMKVLDALADILADKPGLMVNFCYYARQPEAMDSLSSLLVLTDYARVYPDVKGHNPDSVRKYLMVKLIPAGKDTTGTLQQLGRRYIGEQRLSAVSDSVVRQQAAFIRGYFLKEKQLSQERFTIAEIQQDTIKGAMGMKVFRVYFAARE